MTEFSSYDCWSTSHKKITLQPTSFGFSFLQQTFFLFVSKIHVEGCLLRSLIPLFTVCQFQICPNLLVIDLSPFQTSARGLSYKWPSVSTQRAGSPRSKANAKCTQRGHMMFWKTTCFVLCRLSECQGRVKFWVDFKACVWIKACASSNITSLRSRFMTNSAFEMQYLLLLYTLNSR